MSKPHEQLSSQRGDLPSKLFMRFGVRRSCPWRKGGKRLDSAKSFAAACKGVTRKQVLGLRGSGFRVKGLRV